VLAELAELAELGLELERCAVASDGSAAGDEREWPAMMGRKEQRSAVYWGEGDEKSERSQRKKCGTDRDRRERVPNTFRTAQVGGVDGVM